MTEPTLLDKTEGDQEKSDAIERIKLAREAREAAERQIRERSKQRDDGHEWTTEKAWRNRRAHDRA